MLFATRVFFAAMLISSGVAPLFAEHTVTCRAFDVERIECDRLATRLGIIAANSEPRQKSNTAGHRRVTGGDTPAVASSQGTATQPQASPSSPSDQPASATDELERERKRRGDVLADAPDRETQIEQLYHAWQRLPIAAGLAALLALRPRRRGTPKRQAPVVQTQIILAIVGAVVMLVVGSSLARAFGIVGAAGLVRYRAKIEDPKDAGVMLSTLAIGLAAGVGLWMLAAFGTVFILAVLWIVESFEPKAQQLFTLVVKAKDPAAIKRPVEQLLSRSRVKFDLRAASNEEVHYEVHVPIDRRTDPLSEAILKIDPGNATAVEWMEKKEKK